MRMPLPLVVPLVVLVSVLLAQGCSKGDQEAKARLFSPPPPDPMESLAKEEIPVFELATNGDAWKRVNRMPYGEMRRRLGSFVYVSEGHLAFQRQKLEIQSTEKVRLVQAPGDDFSIALATGDGSTQDIVFANGVLFLKNNNGKWRASRDPKGERTALLDDSAGVWRSFFDLFAHALVVEKVEGLKKHGGREVVRYALSVKGEGEKAAAEGAGKPALPTEIPFAAVDAGPGGDEGAPEARAAITERVRRWRENAHPAGGKGEILVDTQTGVPLKVSFQGALAVGDAPTPGKLDVVISVALSELGADLEVQAPKEAIEEISRKKWPTDPRAELEREGIVPPEAPAPPAAAPAAEGGGTKG